MYIIVHIRYGGYLNKIYFILFDILCPLYTVYDHIWNPNIERYDDTINSNGRKVKYEPRCTKNMLAVSKRL